MNSKRKYLLEHQMTLYQPCKYSFQDLLEKAGEPEFKEKLYSLSQKDRNKEVKRLCKKAGWYYEDEVGNDGITYTAFSPKLSFQVFQPKGDMLWKNRHHLDTLLPFAE